MSPLEICLIISVCLLLFIVLVLGVVLTKNKRNVKKLTKSINKYLEKGEIYVMIISSFFFLYDMANRETHHIEIRALHACHTHIANPFLYAICPCFVKGHIFFYIIFYLL